MSRYFTNVKNTIEERVNKAYIDELYTKDTQGEFRKIVAGESGGGGVPVDLPTYLKEDIIDFNTDGETGSTMIAGREITTFISTLLDEGKMTQLTPSALWHTDPNQEPTNIYASYPLIINAAKKLDGVEYIKPNKIEFTDGSGMSSGTLHYRDDESALQSVSIKALAEAGGVLPNYIKSNSIQFNDDSDPGFSRIEQDVIGTNTFSAEDFSGTSTLYGPTTIFRRESGVNKEANVNDVIDVANKFKDVTGTVATINNIHNKLGGVAANASLNSINIQTSLLKMNSINSLAVDIDTVVNNLKDLESTAAEIDAAVANSGGGTSYPYLNDNSIEIVTTSDTTTSFRSIGPGTHTQITSKAFRAYKNSGTNTAFNNTTIDGNGMYIKGSTSASYTEYLNNDIWVLNGSQSYNASVQDIITSTNKIKDFSANEINDAISSAQVNSIKTRSVSPTDTLKLHTSFNDAADGTPNVDSLAIPDVPGTYILSFTGDWGSVSGWGVKKFYIYGPVNKLMTINARFRGTGYDYVMVSPIMRDSLPNGSFMMYQFSVLNIDPSTVPSVTTGLEIIFTVSNHSVGTDTW